MCGIAGMVGRLDEAVLHQMCQMMRHRGPDDQGYYANGSVGLGVVRLSIIDVASGHQPMTDERSRYQLVFNGEIYNYQALRGQLEERGHRLVTRSDTEVIVHLYEDHQEHCVDHLNGDFAFAIWDTERQRLFLARDRLGVKPLYYWHRGTHFAFASELKALLCVPEISRELDYEALDAYLTFLYVPSPRSIFRDIHKLPPACHLTFSDGMAKVERYWRLPQPDASARSSAELCEGIRERLKEAVRMRLMSDVPLGAFLSGGIDSSAVVALMSQCSRQPVRTFSLGFGKPYESYNELPFARKIADTFQTEHHEVIVKAETAQWLPQIVWHLDEPFADSSALLTFLISREAKHAVTVALTGIGGDELFGGYPRYLGAWSSLFYARLPRMIRRALAAFADTLPEATTSPNRAGWLKRFTRGSLELPDVRYLSWLAYATGAYTQQLYTEELRTSLAGSQPFSSYHTVLNGMRGDYLDRMNALDLMAYLPDDLLIMGDKMSMAHGLEVRVPFCDHALVEFAASIPMKQRLHGFRLKALLKQAIQDLLPPELLQKPKQGFMVPIGGWLKRELEPLCQDVLAPTAITRRGLFRPEAIADLRAAHQRGSINAAHQIYALVVFELWCRQYVDRSPTSCAS